MSSEAARDQLDDVLGLLQDQIADIAAMQKKQADLTATERAADGTVEVTVNAGGQVVKTIIDKSFLDEYEFEDLAGHITAAAQAAAKEAGRLVAELLAPINARHNKLPSFSEIVDGLPDAKDLMSVGRDLWANAAQPQQDSASEADDDGEGEPGLVTVRR